MTRWFIFQASGAPIGPHPTDVIAQGLIDGKIGRDAYVAEEGGAQWQQITKVGEIVVAARKLQSAARASTQERPAPMNTVPPAPPPKPSAAPPPKPSAAPPPKPSAAPPVRVPKLAAMTIAQYPAPPANAPEPPAAPQIEAAPVPPPGSVPPPAEPAVVTAMAQEDEALATEPTAEDPPIAPLAALAPEPAVAALPAASRNRVLLMGIALGVFGVLVLLGLALVGMWLLR